MGTLFYLYRIKRLDKIKLFSLLTLWSTVDRTKVHKDLSTDSYSTMDCNFPLRISYKCVEIRVTCLQVFCPNGKKRDVYSYVLKEVEDVLSGNIVKTVVHPVVHHKN